MTDEEMTRALAEVRDELIRRGAAPSMGKDHANARGVLLTFLGVLDSWIEGAHENHQAMGHRKENTGEECWRSFDSSDIRRMVNDTARDLGLPELFVKPQNPIEDQVAQR